MVSKANEPELHRSLKNRHVQMIALGGAIGTGLFYGSASSIALAGPSILFTYLVGGAIIFLVMRALGEMSVDHPVSGAFSLYAYEYWSPRAGFVSGWNYWFNYVLVSMAELSVIGLYINYWLPGVPAWVSALVALVVITFINLVSVKAFGEFEFWFAIIKVVAVIGMIVLGAIVVIAGINNSSSLPDPSFTHLWREGGWFPNGFSGAAMALVPVMFSFGGIELIGVTAGEAEDPKRTIPRAINQIVYRILIFYVGSLAVIMSVVPWNRIDGELSPFVQIFDNVGISFAAHILNLVVLTAALSVYNSALYSNGRMLFTLAGQKNAPGFLTRLSSRGAPFAGVTVSSLAGLVSVLVVFLWQEFAFSYLLSVALIAGIINWVMIMITQLKFRAKIGADGVSQLAFKLPGGKVSTVIVLVALGYVVVQMALSPNYRTAIAVGIVWLAVLLGAYEVKKRWGAKAR